MGGIIAALIAAVGGGVFVSAALFLGSPGPDRDVARRRAA